MPLLEVNGAQINYEFSGPSDRPTLMFSNSLGTNLGMWAGQVASLGQRWRILRYDTRGHGQSEVTAGPYTIGQLADDVLALLDRLEVDKVRFCGLSMGGMIGMTLGLRAPQRIRKLMLCNTAAKIGAAEIWNGRIAAVERGGMAAIADAVLERWYTAEFRAKSPAAVEATKKMLLRTPPEGYRANCAAIRDADLREAVAGIRVPTLIITGAHDPVTTKTDGYFLAEHVSGSRCAVLPAAHLSNIEAADEFTKELTTFLDE
jgi:3-oxoadipate enol-lactonase